MTSRMYSPERVQAAVSRPAYFELDRSTWDERVARAVNALADCRACPCDCGVNRLKIGQPAPLKFDTSLQNSRRRRLRAAAETASPPE